MPRSRQAQAWTEVGRQLVGPSAVRRQYGVLTIRAQSPKLLGMGRNSRSEQLQIRVSPAAKAAIRRAAEHAGLDMSAYVLSRTLPGPAMRLQACIEECAGPAPSSFGLAELNALLTGWTAAELRDAIAVRPTTALTPFLSNYIAAMIEHACERRSVRVPGWVRAIEPLPEPAFGSTLKSLRLHLLTHSPPPFRRRNIFIDATLGDRV